MSKNGYLILGYPRNIDYEQESKRRKIRKPKGDIKFNTLYKCLSCDKVWEHYLTHRRQFIAYTDIPSYGLERNKCLKCKGEKHG